MKKDNYSGIFNIHKPVGISPLDAINTLKEKYSELKNEKMTYAGRLDPMAEGALLILAGKAVYEKEKYLKLDKEYEGEILFGFETDTYDVLGLPKKSKHSVSIPRTVLEKTLEKFLGKNKMPLPPYSSYKIKGTPLFQWARNGKLKEIKIPKKEIEIYEIKLLGTRKTNCKNMLSKIIKKIKTVRGDFRQKEILNRWGKICPQNSDRQLAGTFENQEKYIVAKIKIACSSGTYIRSIAHQLGKELKIGATLLSLTRTKVGDFNIKNSLRM